MKNHIKILFIIFAFSLLTFALMPAILNSTPASTAVGNWYQQFMPNIGSRSITDIFFLDSLTGYAVTNKSTTDTMFVLKTSNSGDNWTIHFRKVQTGGGTPGYNRVYFLNQDTGYACYTLGFDKTINGGANWTPLRTGESFQDMSVLNNDNIWIVSANPLTGGVFFTSTGGTNWVQQYSAGSQNPEKIYMYNARIGFISDNSGSPSIRKTTNGGLNWNLNVSGQYYRDIIFTDSLTGWYSYGNNVYKTTNGGTNWQLQVLPYGGNLISVGINEFSAINKDTLLAIGAEIITGMQSRGIIYRTVNGGVNWTFQIPDTSIYVPGPYNYIQFTDKNHGWAYTLGFYGGIHTTTGGDPVWITAFEQISTEIPKEFKLFQNHPNPFNPNTKIKFQLTKRSYAEITIYDITGRRIQKLLNDELNAGEYEIDFNASGLSSGTYFYKLTVTTGKEEFTETKKMILIK